MRSLPFLELIQSAAAPVPLLVAIACSGAAGAPEPPSAPRSRTLGPMDRLELLVEPLDPGPDVLRPLPERVLGAVRQVLEPLPDDERARIAASVEAASERPLLHLAAGGSSPAAWVALATTSRGADEAVEAARRAGVDVASLVGPVAEMTRRAAGHALGNYVGRLVAPDAPPEIYDVADAAARTLGRGDVRVAIARVRVHRLQSDQARLLLAQQLAQQLEIVEAERWVAEVTASAGAKQLGVELAEVGQALALAASGTAALQPGASEAARLRGALDLLALGRADDALVALGRADAAVPPLDRAALRARALVADSTCPGLPPVVLTSALCATAWAASPAAREATRLMEAAWAARGPRPTAAVDAYVGFVHVLPFTHAAERSMDASALVERLRALVAALAGLEEPSARHRGMTVFAQALLAGFEAMQHGALGRLDDALADRLVAEALALSPEDLRAPLPQAAILAVASLIVRDRDVAPLLARLPVESHPPLLAAAASLSAFSGLGWGPADVVGAARDRLGEAMLREHSVAERSTTILLMAEMDAAREPDERRLDVLVKVGAQLAADPSAGSLSARGALDQSGALSARQQWRQAVDALAVIEAAPVVDALGWLARSASLVYGAQIVAAVEAGAPAPDARAGDGRAREPGSPKLSHGERLGALRDAESASRAGAPSAWVSAWAEALAHAHALDACGARSACRGRVERARKRVNIERLAGVTAARLLARGTVAVSATELMLRYDPPDGVDPVVRIDLALLPMAAPPGYGAQPESSSSKASASRSRSR